VAAQLTASQEGFSSVSNVRMYSIQKGVHRQNIGAVTIMGLFTIHESLKPCK
jgi:hypothetical protein